MPQLTTVNQFNFKDRKPSTRGAFRRLFDMGVVTYGSADESSVEDKETTIDYLLMDNTVEAALAEIREKFIEDPSQYEDV